MEAQIKSAPQTRAKVMADCFTQIYNGGCLVLCYLFILMGSITTNAKELLEAALDLLWNGYLGEDCYVKDFAMIDEWVQSKTVPSAMRQRHKIEWRAPTEKVSGLSLAKYKSDRCKEGHWVVLKDGELYFNPLESSINVNEGKIIEQRVITV